MIRSLVFAVVLVPTAGLGENWVQCPPKPLCAVLSGNVVFLGTVLTTDLAQSRVRLRIDEAFQGIATGTKEAVVDPLWQNEDSGPFYRTGEQWLVVARPTAPAFVDGPCTESRRADLPGFAKDLAMLRTFRDTGKLPSVQGLVSLSPGYRLHPMAGAKVTLRGAGRPVEAVTQDDGTYTMFGVPRGRYQAQIVLAPFQAKPPSQRVEVPAKGCGFADFQLRADAEVRGVVLDAQGKPVLRVSIDALLAGIDPSRYVHQWHAVTDVRGRFVIRGLPPVRIKLVAEGGSEQLLELKPNEQKAGVVFKLPAAR